MRGDDKKINNNNKCLIMLNACHEFLYIYIYINFQQFAFLIIYEASYHVLKRKLFLIYK